MEGKDANATAMLRKNCNDLMKYLIDTQNMNGINRLLDLGCVTKKNIDEFIHYAINKKKYEPQIALTRYKANHIDFSNIYEEFLLN